MVKKINLYKNFNIKNNDKGSIILIGSFDGLHLGHRKLFERAKKLKSKSKLKIGVFTFDPIPKMFFSKGLTNYRISNLNEKIKIFKNFNVDFVINQKFNKKFSKGIYGNATKKQLRELNEEGIETQVFPWIEDKNN